MPGALTALAGGFEREEQRDAVHPSQRPHPPAVRAEIARSHESSGVLARRYRRLKVEHRTTRPYTPRTNGMVERFNGRVQREVLGITIHSHRDLEILMHGFNRAYNARRQRVLGGVSPGEAVRRRLETNPRLASTRHQPPSDPCALPKALLVVAAAKELSHPDS